MTDHLTIDALNERTGLSPRAVRYYVQMGVIDPPAGKGRGSRYGERHVRQIRGAQDLKARGYTIEQIAEGRRGAIAFPAVMRSAAAPSVSHSVAPAKTLHLQISPDITSCLTGHAAEAAGGIDLPALQQALRKTFRRFGL